MNHVDKNGACSDLTTPRRLRKIAVGFEKQCAAHDRYQLSQSPRIDHLFGFGHDGAVCAVVTNQNFGICGRYTVHQDLCFLHRGGNRFFEQYRNACSHALHSLRHVQGIRCSQDDAVWFVLREQGL